MAQNKPLPKINADSRFFWEGCQTHELRFQKCTSCGQIRWPPALLCPHCLSAETETIKAAGRGTVYSFAVYHTAFDPAFRDDVPYVVAIVALEEGPHLITNIVGCHPADVSCDMAVEVIWEDSPQGLTLPKFRPQR
ncbi:MAG: OB-fold domain-containing protein [Syntrophales bacterium]|nr:OB-fold domain-containing protein [Syntrophales bacterium]